MSTLMKNDKTIAGLVESEKSSFGTAVDLTQYTSSNSYTAPSDGYVYVNLYSAGHTATIIVNSRIGIVATYAGSQIMQSVYVKAGMTMYATATGADARYVPLQ